MKLALAGSRDLPLDLTARHVLQQLVDLPPQSSVLLRRPRSPKRRIGSFELTCAKLAKILGLGVEWWPPAEGGRESVFVRDLDMVSRADLVVAYFPSAEITGGTGHVVEAAWSKGAPVKALWIRPDGSEELIGAYDPGADGP